MSMTESEKRYEVAVMSAIEEAERNGVSPSFRVAILLAIASRMAVAFGKSLVSLTRSLGFAYSVAMQAKSISDGNGEIQN